MTNIKLCRHQSGMVIKCVMIFNIFPRDQSANETCHPSFRMESEVERSVDYIRVHRGQLNFNKFYLVSANCDGELVAKMAANRYFHVRDNTVLRTKPQNMLHVYISGVGS